MKKLFAGLFTDAAPDVTALRALHAERHAERTAAAIAAINSPEAALTNLRAAAEELHRVGMKSSGDLILRSVEVLTEATRTAAPAPVGAAPDHNPGQPRQHFDRTYRGAAEAHPQP